ncbi:hypothetical protein MTO96_002618 [Rhipicephalus appendiculatus]
MIRLDLIYLVDNAAPVRTLLEEFLQEALDVTERFLEGTGLVLSPTKSELLLFRKARQGMWNLEPLDSLPSASFLHRLAPRRPAQASSPGCFVVLFVVGAVEKRLRRVRTIRERISRSARAPGLASFAGN